MDTSKEYIEMCEHAYEIQRQWHPKIGDIVGGFDTGDTTIINAMFHTGTLEFLDGGSVSHQTTVIWLPHQDELYELHTPLDSKGYSAYGLARMFGIWLYAHRDYTYEQGFDSVEQHLLAFVMWDVFEKRWGGSEWEMI